MRVHNPIKPYCDSFIGWLGGKFRLRGTIVNSIPEHECYCEVFCGAASVWAAKDPKTSKREYINDIHKELVNLMEIVAGTMFDDPDREKHFAEFRQMVRTMPAARDAHERYRRMKPDQIARLSKAERAYRFYYCVKKGFSCVETGGFEASPYSTSRLNMTTDFAPIVARFQANNTTIENLDFEAFLTKYNKTRTKVFFYMDPPYFVADDTNYYEHVLTPEQHQSLREWCGEIDRIGNLFLLSYDDVREVIALYKGFYIYRTDKIIYKASDEKVERELAKHELIITNYDIAEVIRHRLKCKATTTGGYFDAFDDDIDDSDPDNIELDGCVGLRLIERPKIATISEQEIQPS
jgi:DNA adenine methylase